MADELKPATIVSRGNVVLVFERDSEIFRRLYVYGTATWESEDSIANGHHPQLADQANLLWLTWEDSQVLNYSTSEDGGRNFTAATPLSWLGTTPSVSVLSSGFVGIAFASNGAIRFSKEEDNFATIANIIGYSTTPTKIVLRRYSSRLICGWIEDEEGLLVYSDDEGVTWSVPISLGDATGLDINCSLSSDHMLAVVEYSHDTYGLVSRNAGINWDSRWRIWLPDASVDPTILVDAINDIIVFTGVLDVSVPLQHEYKIQLTNAPFFAYISEVLDLGDMLTGPEEWHVLPDWFYWGPRSWMKFDLRSGEASVPDVNWSIWEEAYDAKEFSHTLNRYMQHRFYAIVPQDVRESRNESVLPEFIYRLFNVRWWGVKPYYMYYPIYSWYSYQDVHYEGDEQRVTGYREWSNDDKLPVLEDDDLLPVYQV